MSKRFCAAIVLAATLLAAPCRGQSLSNVIFVAFDQETTGLDPKRDRVIEIGAVKFRNGTIIDSTNWLINPGVPVPEPARRVNGITDAMLAGRPAFPEVFRQFTNFAGGAVAFAHNARFDAAMFASEIKRSNLQPPGNLVLDTLALSRKWFPEAGGYELAELAAHLKIRSAGFHRAREDAECLANLVIIGLARMPANARLSDLRSLSSAVFRLGEAPERRDIRKSN